MRVSTATHNTVTMVGTVVMDSITTTIEEDTSKMPLLDYGKTGKNQIEFQDKSSNFMNVRLINGWMMNVHCHCMYQKQCKV